MDWGAGAGGPFPFPSGLLLDPKQGESVCCNFPTCVRFSFKCFTCHLSVKSIFLKEVSSLRLVQVEGRDAMGGERES